jgi:hypothetical protein
MATKLCECCDPHCPIHSGTDCPQREPHLTAVRRVNGLWTDVVYFCGACAAGALGSGVFACQQ